MTYNIIILIGLVIGLYLWLNDDDDNHYNDDGLILKT